MTHGWWIVKQEPTDYSWADLVRDGRTVWTGVRNYAARNHLRSMRIGDGVFFYHSGDEKRLVGVARVCRAAYADPTATGGDWSCVELAPEKVLREPVDLATVKRDSLLRGLALVRQSRLSVTPVEGVAARRILDLSHTSLEG